MGLGDWSDRNKKLTRGVHGTIVGTAMIAGGYVIGMPLFEDGDLSLIEAVFLGSMVFVGCVASMPWIFMPIFHSILEAWKSRKDGGQS